MWPSTRPEDRISKFSQIVNHHFMSPDTFGWWRMLISHPAGRDFLSLDFLFFLCIKCQSHCGNVILIDFLFLGTHMCLIFPEEVIQYKMCHLCRLHSISCLCSFYLSTLWAITHVCFCAQANSAFPLLPIQIKSKQIPIKCCVISTWPRGKYIWRIISTHFSSSGSA